MNALRRYLRHQPTGPSHNEPSSLPVTVASHLLRYVKGDMGLAIRVLRNDGMLRCQLGKQL